MFLLPMTRLNAQGLGYRGMIRVRAVNDRRKAFGKRFQIDHEFRRDVLQGLVEYAQWTSKGRPDLSRGGEDAGDREKVRSRPREISQGRL